MAGQLTLAQPMEVRPLPRQPIIDSPLGAVYDSAAAADEFQNDGENINVDQGSPQSARQMRPLRLVDQDAWFSATKQGFDSPRGCQFFVGAFGGRNMLIQGRFRRFETCLRHILQP